MKNVNGVFCIACFILLSTLAGAAELETEEVVWCQDQTYATLNGTAGETEMEEPFCDTELPCCINGMSAYYSCLETMPALCLEACVWEAWSNLGHYYPHCMPQPTVCDPVYNKFLNDCIRFNGCDDQWYIQIMCFNVGMSTFQYCINGGD